MTERTAIVTLAVGEKHRDLWHRLCEQNWHRYAERHGYDVICIDEPLDRADRAAARSPSWQKLLVAGQPFAEDYDRIVWVDADVLFGHEARPIAEGVPEHLVGAVDEVSMERPDLRRLLHPDPPGEYLETGLPRGFPQMVQGGVFVFTPRHHRELLEGVYRDYEEGDSTLYEMRPLSYELLDQQRVHWLDPRFNLIWFVYRAQHAPELARYRRHPKARALAERALEEVDLLHFAGEADQMEYLLERPRTSVSLSRSRARTRTPVALLIHQRPDTTSRVLESIRDARPSRLLVIADGPRPDSPGEAERCHETRELIEAVDWDCEVDTNYSDQNLGMKVRTESGLDWVFSKIPEAIFLEDDTLPDRTFFPFCDELLERYRSDERVMSVSGNNFQFDRLASAESYYFSRHSLSWGWATWRDAWAHRDPEMSAWPELRDRDWLHEIFSERHAVQYWSHVLEKTYRDRDTWDRAWQLACWRRGGLHAIPNRNLVTNIGFREDATSTRIEAEPLLGNLPMEPMEFPLRHPPEVRRQAEADSELDGVLFGGTIADMFDRLLLVRRGMVAVP